MLFGAPIASITASRGSGIGNLLSGSPKEIWADSASGSTVNIDIDLGSAQPIDTVYLGYVSPPDATSSWTITAGAAGYTDAVIKASSPLRAIDSLTRSPDRTHALWLGNIANVRYLRLSLVQPAGKPALSAGIVMAGKSWRPGFNMERGSGRRVIDLGSVVSLPDGGFAPVEAGRRREFSWTFGDLSESEADELEEHILDFGETRPLLVVEDPDARAGQRNRVHYGLLTGLKAFERKNAAQTSWEFTLQEWT